MSESSTTYRRRFPFPSVRQFSMFFVVSTFFMGQAVMVKEIGMWSEIGGLYEMGFLFILIYVVYPQLSHIAHGVIILIGNHIGGEPDEQ